LRGDTAAAVAYPKVVTSASSGLLLIDGWLIGRFGAPDAI